MDENIIIVFERKEGERSIEVNYNDAITLNSVIKICYEKCVFSRGGNFYAYCIYDFNDNLMAQITVDNILNFEKDSRYNRYLLHS